MTTHTRSSTNEWTLSSNKSTVFEKFPGSAFSEHQPKSVPNLGSEFRETIAYDAPDRRHISVPLRNAITKFRARLTGQLLLEFEGTTYDQLCSEIIRIQREQEGSKTMMNLSRIQSFLEAMEQFGKIIEVFINVADMVAFVWGPIKFLLLTASNFTDSFETLLEAYEQIGEQLPLLAEYEILFRESPHMLDALELMYIDILVFHQHAIRFFSGKVWKRIFKAVWKNFSTEFGGILKSLARHKDLVECRATLTQYRKYQEDMTGLKVNVEELVKDQHVKKATRVKEWLATGAQSLYDHERFLAEREPYPSTGRWILDHEIISDWMNTDVPTSPIVWMTGIPGAGKTILASVVIEECKRRSNALTTYFYCNYNGNNTAVSVFKGIMDQLLDQYPDLVPYCHHRYTTSGEPLLRSLTLSKKLLEDFCFTVPKQVIVIDGLDECESADRKQVLDYFVQLVGQCDTDDPGKLRVLFVSQDYPDIKRALQSSTVARTVPKQLPLSDADNGRDINVYINHFVARIKEKFGISEDQERYIQKMAVDRAKGMFLYAKLVMTNLFDQPSLGNLIGEIQSEIFPKELEDAYERILRRIKTTTGEAEWQVAKKLLGWMVCAKRQLTWREMQVALSLNFEAQTVEYDDRRLRRHIHDICGSLIQVSGDRIQLVHSTAKHYITKCTQDIHEPSVECGLAAICLQYLTFPCFNDDNDLDKHSLRNLTLEGYLAFQDYAVAKWFHHVTAFIDTGPSLLNEGVNVLKLLQEISVALDDFLTRYDENWDAHIVEECRDKCSDFKSENFYDNLVAVASHIYTFQKKGFDARHVISIKSLADALERNRKLLEELPKELKGSELETYRQFYDDTHRYKCTKITCQYFSEGFKDAKTRKRHVNLHDRPFHCEVLSCLGAESGFTNANDLEKHKRAFHPEEVDLANTFKPAANVRTKTQWTCNICNKNFTRNFHLQNHLKSHRGERPEVCSECGKAFTRRNDLKRHQKLHDRR